MHNHDKLGQQFDAAVAILTEEEVDAARKAAYTELQCGPDCPHGDCGAKMFETIEAAGGKEAEAALAMMGAIPHEIVIAVMQKCVEAAEKKRLRDLTEFDPNSLKGTPWDRN